jgi:hypothetical protein
MTDKANHHGAPPGLWMLKFHIQSKLTALPCCEDYSWDISNLLLEKFQAAEQISITNEC